jgi:two-component system sensor histidine kinase BarA
MDHRPWPLARQVICLSGLGDGNAAAALRGGLVDDLLDMPCRRADIAAMVERMAAGRLRGPAALRTSAIAMPSASFAGRHVLVADDNAVNREVLIEVLRQLDVTVDTAVNGREAVAAWLRRKPDLVFMDCSMPEMDGFTATREIRAHERLAVGFQRTPIIALTALLGGASGTANWQESGMDGLMVKPFTMRGMIACLSQYFDAQPVAAAMPKLSAQAQLPLIDPEVIAELRGIGGNDALFRRVLDLFTSRVPLAVDTVTAMIAEGDLGALADATHALTSMCANIGASRAVEACRVLEKAARSGKAFDAGAMAAAVAAEMRSVLAEIATLRAA